ncbi:TPA: CopG family transcriptional regulator [Streptococcus suis]|uniref:CopG family transcriptional regulator n=1 Tax=Streptococcus suis TaxID=1307 RepID=UPI000769504D|nr:CopG family transcriptional regulator [Streptococcus suis]MCK3859643.1 CopG family transcriptional regulator [Streptococcus suis]NQJ99823.1 CopG family transcriptional regulator [Streptococcus suis]CYZ27147.1 phage protein [Streptococcus suis]HEM4388653.1 CopG family transcriptional regulator [Streptococcus suis]HEM4610187.1 CopG family transcriptional regulator [Streptococcus suis]
MSAKMGRPVKGSEPMDKQLVVRMTETMHNNITEYAEKNGIGKMEVVRKAVEEFFDK